MKELFAVQQQVKFYEDVCYYEDIAGIKLVSGNIATTRLQGKVSWWNFYNNYHPHHSYYSNNITIINIVISISISKDLWNALHRMGHKRPKQFESRDQTPLVHTMVHHKANLW